MANLTITKAFLIDVLKKEKPYLSAGQYISDYSDELIKDKNCDVCAVGALISHVLHPENFYMDVEHLCSRLVHKPIPEANTTEEYEILKEAEMFLEIDPLSTLSIAFEGLNTLFSPDEVFIKLIDFIEATFPNDFEIELPYAVFLADGLKVKENEQSKNC